MQSYNLHFPKMFPPLQRGQYSNANENQFVFAFSKNASAIMWTIFKCKLKVENENAKTLFIFHNMNGII